MAYQIRAMSFSELLDTAARVLLDRFGLLVGITSAVYIPLAVINDGAQPAPGQIVWGRVVAGLVVSMVAMPIATTALTYAVGETYLGRPTSIGRSFRAALRLIVPLVGTMMLVYLGVFAGIILLIIPGIYFSLAWLLASVVVILEGRYGPRALGRSRELMRGNMMRGVGLLLIGWIIVALLSSVLGVVFRLVPIVGPIAQGLAQAVGVTYSSIVLVLLYFDIRCRKEAFDLEHLAQLVEAGTSDVAA